MLVRTVSEGGVLVLGGDHPGVIAVLKARTTKAKLGLTVHTEVPIFNVKVLRAIIRRELEQAPQEPSDLSESLSREEIIALRTMMVLLEDPVSNSAAIIELLVSSGLVDLTFGAAPNDE